jgi:hypothetical protein
MQGRENLRRIKPGDGPGHQAYADVRRDEQSLIIQPTTSTSCRTNSRSQARFDVGEITPRT